MSKSVLSILLTVSLVLAVCTTPTRAQEVQPDEIYEIYRLPEGFDWSEDGAEDSEGNPVGNTYMCYDWDKFKLLLTMDNDLRLAEGQVNNLKVSASELRLSAVALREALVTAESQTSLMRQDRDRLFEKWKSDNKAKHIAESKPAFGSWIPWALSGVLGAVLGGTIIGVVASD